MATLLRHRADPEERIGALHFAIYGGGDFGNCSGGVYNDVLLHALAVQTLLAEGASPAATGCPHDLYYMRPLKGPIGPWLLLLLPLGVNRPLPNAAWLAHVCGRCLAFERS